LSQLPTRRPILILGAGPAGLGAALQLARRGVFDVTVLERNACVGGNAGSFEFSGQRVDYGSHRLHPACSPEILADIRGMIGEDLLDQPRHGRIRLRGRWLHFPLQPVDLALHVPLPFLAGIARDAVFKKRAESGPETFASVLERSLGQTICRDFYFPYATKIWGVDASALDAEQARRRVSAGSMMKMLRRVLSVVPGLKPPGAGRFFYPRHGYGQISEAYARAARAAGARIRLEEGMASIELTDGAAATVVTERGERLPAAHVLSTVPLPALVRAARPAAPDDIVASARALRYRAMMLVYLALETARFTEYDAHYFPGSDVAITRLSEPKNYSLLGPSNTTVLCAELPCATTDPIWQASDEGVGKVVLDALAAAALPVTVPVREVSTRRLSHAYPIYTRDYRAHFERLDRWAGGIDRLLTFGRQGLFAHDNTHHALAMAYAANESLDDRGHLDRTRWEAHRRSFEKHVVED
jgi:protoporphyrinogen oxidase